MIRGSRDDPLSDIGWSQMWSAVGQANPWHEIVSSPLSRCAAFARELGRHLELSVHEERRFQEIGFGDWEGADPVELYESVPEAVTNFWSDPAAHPPPGGEPFGQFQKRVVAALESVIENHRSRHVLVVCHGGVIRMLIAHVLGMPPVNMFRMEVPYAAVSRIQIQDGIARLVFHCGKL